MRWILRLVPSPAMAVACLALLVALGGVGYAAVKLPANSVGSAQLKNDAVTGLKVKNGTLLAADFKRGQVVGKTGAKGDPGLKGDTGPKGDQGPKGDTGDRGPSWGDVSGVGSGTGASPDHPQAGRRRVVEAPGRRAAASSARRSSSSSVASTST